MLNEVVESARALTGGRYGAIATIGEAGVPHDFVTSGFTADELGYVPLSQTGSELLFDVFSQRYENGVTIVASNLPFQEWTTVFASERLTGALLDRITHNVHILEMNGQSFRLNHSRARNKGSTT